MVEAVISCCREVPSDYADLAEICPEVYDAANAFRVFGSIVADEFDKAVTDRTFDAATAQSSPARQHRRFERLDDDALPQIDGAFLSIGKQPNLDNRSSEVLTVVSEALATAHLQTLESARSRASHSESATRSLSSYFRTAIRACGSIKGILALRIALSTMALSGASKQLDGLDSGSKGGGSRPSDEDDFRMLSAARDS